MLPPSHDRTPRERDLFLKALDFQTGPDREAFLRGACAGDPNLRRAVEALLKQHGNAGPSVESGPTVVAVGRPATKPTTSAIQPEGPGTRIGRYKLLQQIGEGGMGVVYIAEQAEPVRRRVALKIIRLGMDTREVVARFEAERQALAMMDHPNIARVFDVGATDSGRPYFVMELVKGVPLTHYCDEHELDPPQRLDLFLQVCAAIQHAHQKGIIHRDIKPGNVLITVQDGQPVAKVIDFGIAKATGQQLTDKTVYTAFHQIIGTPAYMSPEQAGLSGLDIDTRSDIYSLGVLLYELLAGKPPFDPKSLVNGSLEEMRRVIRDVEPPLPSNRLSSLEADELAVVARKRQLDPRKLRLLLRGDLDQIVMKAIEKDRARRYESADTFAADVRRFLNHEPVSAMAPSPAYRFDRFIRRNRVAVGISSTILFLLVAGIASSTWFGVAATRAAAGRTQVARFLQDMLESVGPAKARGRDTAMLREILDTTAKRLGRDSRIPPEAELELRGTLGRTYAALGAWTNAEAIQRRAVDLAKELHGSMHTNVAVALLDLGITLTRRAHYREATNLLLAALDIDQRLVGDKHPLTSEPLNRLGNVYWLLGNYTNAEPLLLRAIAIRRGALGPDHRDTLEAEINLASLYFQQGRTAAMEPLVTNALDRLRSTLGEDHPTTLLALNLLAIQRQTQGRFQDSEALHREVVELQRRVLGPDHLFTLTSMNNLGIVYGFEGRQVEAERICREAIAGYEPKAGAEHPNTLAFKSNLAEYLRNQGRFSEAEALFEQVIAIQARTMEANDPFRLETQNGLGLLCFLRADYPRAELLFREVLQRRRASLPNGDPPVADALGQVVLVLLAQGKAADAEPLARESQEINQRQRPKDWTTHVTESQLGGCLLGLGRLAEAEPLLLHAAEALKQLESRIPAIDRLRLRESAQRVAELYERLGTPQKAVPWRLEAERFPLPRSL